MSQVVRKRGTKMEALVAMSTKRDDQTDRDTGHCLQMGQTPSHVPVNLPVQRRQLKANRIHRGELPMD